MKAALRSVGAIVALGALALGIGCSSDNDSDSGGTAASGAEVIDVDTDEQRPILISTDLAMGLTTGASNGLGDVPNDYDDAYALALAAAFPEQLDIKGIVVTMGNGLLGPQMDSARKTADQLGVDAPVVPGASVWLARREITGIGGDSLDDSCVNGGVDFMAEQLRETPGLTVVAIGPLTDLACLVLTHPREAAEIGEIVALVGSKPNNDFLYNGKTLQDFNFQMDPRAEYILLERSEIPFTAIMYELSSTLGVPVERVLALRESDDETARFFGEASTAYSEYWNGEVGPDKPIWDASVVWRLLNPDVYECEEAGYRLDLGPPGSTSETRPVNQGRVVDRTVEVRIASDYFSPSYSGTRTVTACDSLTSTAEIDRFNDQVFAAVGSD